MTVTAARRQAIEAGVSTETVDSWLGLGIDEAELLFCSLQSGCRPADLLLQWRNSDLKYLPFSNFLDKKFDGEMIFSSSLLKKGKEYLSSYVNHTLF